MTRHYASLWVIWPTTFATWLAFAQVISFQALALFVVGGSVVAAMVIAALCRAGRRLLAVLGIVVLTLGFAWIAEMLAGNTSGPVTRATLMACGVTGAMGLMLHTRYPIAILPASILLLAGALGLGAAGQVPWLAGLWTVAAVLTMAMLGPYRQSDLRDRSRLWPFAAMLLVPGLVAVLAMAVLNPLMTDPWTIPGTGQVAVLPDSADPTAAPSPSSAPSEPTSADPSADSSSPQSEESYTSSAPAPAAPTAPPTESVEAVSPNSLLSWLQVLLLLLLLLVVLAVLVLITWRLWVALLWWRLRGRLGSGSGRQRAIGAWTWLRMRRIRHDSALPVSVSPDVALMWARETAEADVLTIAQVVAPVAFDDSLVVSDEDASRAWVAAGTAGRLPPGSLRQRWRWALRTPGWVRSRMASGSVKQPAARV